MSRLLVILSLAVSVVSASRAQDGPWFYRGLGFGTEAAFSPLTIVINDAYDVLQLDGWDRRFSRHPYRSGWLTVRRSAARPFRTLSRYGYWQFVRSELLPLSTRGDGGGQWLPNYQLHLVGGGMLHVMLTEWYAAHGFARPGVWALGTAVIERVINESIENGGFDGYSGDVVADLYLFDAGGILLYASDRVRRFFSTTLNLRAWPLQPSIGVTHGTLENAGSYFSIQWPLPRTQRWRFFYYFGMNNMAGLTRNRRDGLSVSVGAGLHAKELVTVDASSNRKTANLTGTAGVFVDRQGSLLASLVYSGVHDRQWSMNVYPGVLPGGRASPGVWVQRSREGSVLAGFALRWIPGVGFGGS
jgi:hypothetical protein